jgi:hypothetical protein
VALESLKVEVANAGGMLGGEARESADRSPDDESDREHLANGNGSAGPSHDGDLDA